MSCLWKRHRFLTAFQTHTLATFPHRFVFFNFFFNFWGAHVNMRSSSPAVADGRCGGGCGGGGGGGGVGLLGALLLLLLSLSGCSSMDVLVPSNINALNGTTIKIPCAFTSCYKMDITKFAMNWTYQETVNDTEEIFMTFYRKRGMVALRSEPFGDRVMFAGNLDKNDLSITLSDVQIMDEGIYNCYVRNPPDRIQGKGVIKLTVVTELPPPRDSTIAVAIGASVGGALALLILSMVVVKCLRRHRKQELISEEKMEEEGKLEAEGVAEEETKQP